MNGEKILTIVIPAYNMEKYLYKCCSSLLIKDNFERLDILIINDGSTDSTSKIAHTFEEKYKGIFRVIDKENGNYGSCINRGLKEAKGTFIKILDADDRFDTVHFNDYIRFLLEMEKSSKKKADLIITDMCTVNENGEILKSKSFSLSIKKVDQFERLKLHEADRLTHHSVTYRTRNVQEMHYVQMEGVSYTDQEWIRLPLFSVETYIYFPQTIYLYLIGRPGQTMEPDKFARCSWMQLEIKKHMLHEYVHYKTEYSPSKCKIVEELIVLDIEKAYRFYLIKNKGNLDIHAIQDFDIHLKDCFPDIYDLTEDYYFKNKYPIKYIKYWRQAQRGGPKWKYELTYKCYKTMIYIKSRLKHIFTK